MFRGWQNRTSGSEYYLPRRGQFISERYFPKNSTTSEPYHMLIVY